MNYFKVKLTSDNTAIGKGYSLVRNELFTATQVSKKFDNSFINTHMEPVEVPKNDTYYFFGARFCKQWPYNHS